jgi:hypothetical protein
MRKRLAALPLTPLHGRLVRAIAGLFGGFEQLREAAKELQTLLDAV